MTQYIVITGASSGIGQALTVCFANLDYDIIAIGRNELALQRTKQLAGNKKVTVLVADLTKETELDKIVNIFKPEDRVLYLIHCAATTEPHLPLSKVSPSALTNAINVNVLSPIFLTQKLAPYFDITITRVLFIGSDYVGINNKIRPNVTGSYGISKSALRVAVEYFRHEYRDAVIGYLNPGSTDTPMFEGIKSAILNQKGIFNNLVQPANPVDVAKFIQAVLKFTTDKEYGATDWDYRNQEHHTHNLINETTISSVTVGAKL